MILGSTQALCVGCFAEPAGTQSCRGCSYDERAPRSPVVLPHRQVLKNNYLVGRILGDPGGFGITYLALDAAANDRVAIKEYLPRDLAGRATRDASVVPLTSGDAEMFTYGLRCFAKEAGTLARFNHPNIVRVRDYFKENDTAYMVMDYYDGVTLRRLLEKKGRKLPLPAALQIIMAVLDGLREVHAGQTLHRDVKPENIYVTTRGRVLLIDFGSARSDLGARSHSLAAMVTPGFAPFEQYHGRGRQGPWTDVYACGATLYSMLTGVVPPDAAERKSLDKLVSPRELIPDLPLGINRAIERALAVEAENRQPDATTLQRELFSDSGSLDHATVRGAPVRLESLAGVPTNTPTLGAVAQPEVSAPVLELATRTSRLGATLLDGILFLPFVILLSLADVHGKAFAVLGVLGLAAVAVIQSILLARDGQTCGKKLSDIRIVRLDDGANGGFIANVVVRGGFVLGNAAVGFLLPPVFGMLPFPGVVLLDALLIYRDDQRCLHDIVAGTRVVRS